MMDPSSPAALHTGGCAFGKASLRSERTEGGKNTALALYAFNPQENPRQNSAWSDQQLHSTGAGMTKEMGQIQEAGEGSE